MYGVELYIRVQRAWIVDGMSVREASRAFGLDGDSVPKTLTHSMTAQTEVPGKNQDKFAHRHIIDLVPEGGLCDPWERRHTAKVVDERLTDDYWQVRPHLSERRRTRVMFSPGSRLEKVSGAPGGVR